MQEKLKKALFKEKICEKLTKIGALSFSSVTYMTSVDVEDLANGISPLSVAVTITE